MPAEKPVISEQIQPTIVVGLGGTGKRILTGLKARFIESPTFGAVPRIVKFICLDIDTTEEVIRLADGREVRLEGPEFIDIGNVSVTDVKRQLDARNFPEMRTWFNWRDLPDESLRTGAKQIRPLGRLAFFWHLTRGSAVIEVLKKTIGDVLDQIRLTKEFGGPGRPDEWAARPVPINAFVVCSLAGGTGSGMFLDMAYVLQHLFGERGEIRNTSTVTGILVMPNVFFGAPMKDLRPNALAALKELDYFMTTPDTAKRFATIPYTGGIEVECRAKPFKICYMVDAIAQTGVSLERPEALFPMVVDALFLQVGSRLRATVAGMVDNVQALRDTQNRTVYSTFGVAALVFPAKEVVGICGSRLAREVINQELLAEVPDGARGKIAGDVADFITGKRLEPDVIERRLTREERTREMLIGRLSSDDRLKPAALRGLTRDAVYGTVTTLVRLISPSLEGQVTTRLVEERAGLVKSVIEGDDGLKALVRRYTSDRGRGLEYTIEFLKALHDHLEALSDGLQRKRMAADQQRDVAERAQEAARIAFQKAAGARGPFASDVAKAREAYLVASQDLVDRRFAGEALTYGIQAVDKMVEAVEEERRRLEDLASHFRWLVEAGLQEREDGFWRAIGEMDVVRHKPIVDPEHIQALYDQRKGTKDGEKGAYPQMAAVLYAATKGIASLMGKKREQVAEWVFQAASQAFADIYNMRIEDFILQLETEEGRAKESWLRGTRANAVVFWPYKIADELAAKRESRIVQVIGLEDAGRSLYTEEVAEIGDIFASTGNRHGLTVLRTEHGMTYLTMSQYPTYYDNYKAALPKDSLPRHAFPEFNIGERSKRQTFAWAYAYGLITQSRTDPGQFSYQPSDGGDLVPLSYRLDSNAEVVPGSVRGLYGAISELSLNESLRAEMQRRIRQIEEAKDTTTEDLIRRLEDAAKRLQVSPEDEALAETIREEMRGKAETLKR